MANEETENEDDDFEYERMVVEQCAAMEEARRRRIAAMEYEEIEKSEVLELSPEPWFLRGERGCPEKVIQEEDYSSKFQSSLLIDGGLYLTKGEYVYPRQENRSDIYERVFEIKSITKENQPSLKPIPAAAEAREIKRSQTEIPEEKFGMNAFLFPPGHLEVARKVLNEGLMRDDGDQCPKCLGNYVFVIYEFTNDPRVREVQAKCANCKLCSVKFKAVILDGPKGKDYEHAYFCSLQKLLDGHIGGMSYGLGAEFEKMIASLDGLIPTEGTDEYREEVNRRMEAEEAHRKEQVEYMQSVARSVFCGRDYPVRIDAEDLILDRTWKKRVVCDTSRIGQYCIGEFWGIPIVLRGESAKRWMDFR